MHVHVEAWKDILKVLSRTPLGSDLASFEDITHSTAFVSKEENAISKKKKSNADM